MDYLWQHHGEDGKHDYVIEYHDHVSLYNQPKIALSFLCTYLLKHLCQNLLSTQQQQCITTIFD